MDRRQFLTGTAALGVCFADSPAARRHGGGDGSWLFNARDHGVAGDGVTDDTAAIQSFLDMVAAVPGVAFFPAGTYRVARGRDLHLIDVPDGSAIHLGPGAHIRIDGTDRAEYRIFNIVGRENVIIRGHGSRIQGERAEHRGSAGESGYGLYIEQSRNVLIEDLEVTDFWGDGLFLGHGTVHCLVQRCVFARNRRNNISIVGARQTTLRDCVARDAGGTAPGAGVDIEPNPGDHVADILIERCFVHGNAGDGILSSMYEPGTAVTEDLAVRDCQVHDNGRHGLALNFGARTRVTGCQIFGNAGRGIHNDTAELVGALIQGNAIHDNGDRGISGFSPGARVADNYVHGNGNEGIRWSLAPTVSITGNTVSSARGDGIHAAGLSGSVIASNVVRAAGHHGILVSGACEGIAITGNAIEDAGQAAADRYAGIRLADESRLYTVVGNTIRGARHRRAIQADSAHGYLTGNVYE